MSTALAAPDRWAHLRLLGSTTLNNTLLYKVLALKYLWGFARRVPIPANASINTELGCECAAQACCAEGRWVFVPGFWMRLLKWCISVRAKSSPLWRVPQRYWLQSHSGEDRGWKDMLCSQGRAKAGSHHYNLLNINKIQKYSHKNEQN